MLSLCLRYSLERPRNDGVFAMLGVRFATISTLQLAGAIAAFADVPAPISAPGLSVVAQVHAEGAQIYECKTSATGNLAWQFREPIASLFEDGQTIGKHFAGPQWSIGGDSLKGKVAAKAPGANVGDVPLLRLDVIERQGNGRISGVTTIQRINTLGGNLEGPCDKIGAFRSVAYSADYVFLKK
jgi:hypothetical protein